MTIQETIATLSNGTIIYRDRYMSSGWGGLKGNSYSPYYKGEDTINPDDAPLTASEMAELEDIQQQRIAVRLRTARR